MADFAMLGVALEKVMGWEAGSFIEDYLHQQRETRISALEHSPIIMALIDYVAEEPYSGSFQKLHVVLTSKQRAKGSLLPSVWPKSPKGLSEALKRQQPALKELGIEVTFDAVRKNDGYHVSIDKITSASADDIKNKNSFDLQVHYVHQVHQTTDSVASEASFPVNIDSASSLSSPQVHSNFPTATKTSELSEHSELVNQNFFKKNDSDSSLETSSEDGWVTEVL
jgi:hypothetical protein